MGMARASARALPVKREVRLVMKRILRWTLGIRRRRARWSAGGPVRERGGQVEPQGGGEHDVVHQLGGRVALDVLDAVQGIAIRGLELVVEDIVAEREA